MQDFLGQIVDAVRMRAPVVIVPTHDQVETADKLQSLGSRISQVNRAREENGRPCIPIPHIVEWSSARAFTYPKILKPYFDQKPPIQTSVPSEAFARVANGVPTPGDSEGSILSNTLFVMFNGSEILSKEDPRVLSSIFHCRRVFSEGPHNILVILVSNAGTVPGSILDLAYVIEDPLPAKEEVPHIVTKVVNSLKDDPAFTPPVDKDLDRIYTAVRGMTPFRADQNLFMASTTAGIDLQKLRRAQVNTINATPGCKVLETKLSFEDVGGLTSARTYLDTILKQSEGILIFMDEIDKQLRGANGDSSGVSASQSGMLLSHLQDTGIEGIMLLGPPGTGKSLLATTAGKKHDMLTVSFVLEGVKDKYVGESGRKMAQALDVFGAMYGSGDVPAVWIATCNDISALTPEMQRRFPTAFFVDLPSKEEREAIWNIYLTKENRLGETLPDDMNWTGAEIAQCVKKAKLLGATLIEAATYVVPNYVSNSHTIEALRLGAEDKYLSASYPGRYQSVRPMDNEKSREKRFL